MLKQTYYTFKAPEMIKVFLGFLSYDIHNVNESCISKETRRIQIFDRYSVNTSEHYSWWLIYQGSGGESMRAFAKQ